MFDEVFASQTQGASSDRRDVRVQQGRAQVQGDRAADLAVSFLTGQINPEWMSVDNMNKTQYEKWKKENPDKVSAYEKHYQDMLQSQGNLGFVERMSDADRQKWISSSPKNQKDWQFYVARKQAGDMGFLNNAPDRDFQEWLSWANDKNNPRPDEIKKYVNSQNMYDTGALLFFDKMSPEAQHQWMLTASNDDFQTLKNYQNKMQANAFDFVGELNADNRAEFVREGGKYNLPYSYYLERERVGELGFVKDLNETNQKDYIDPNGKYHSDYVKYQNRRENEDFSDVFAMNDVTKAVWEKIAQAKDPTSYEAFKRYSDYMNAGVLSFVSNLSAENQKVYTDPNGQFHKLYANWKNSEEVGDYSKVLRLTEPAKWFEQNPEKGEAYKEWVAKIIANDLTYVGLLNADNQKDYKDGYYKDYYVEYQKTIDYAIANRDFSFLDRLNEFDPTGKARQQTIDAIYQLAAQGDDTLKTGLEAYNDRVKNLDFTFVLNMDKDKQARWLAGQSEQSQRDFLLFKAMYDAGYMGFIDNLSKDNKAFWLAAANEQAANGNPALKTAYERHLQNMAAGNYSDLQKLTLGQQADWAMRVASDKEVANYFAFVEAQKTKPEPNLNPNPTEPVVTKPPVTEPVVDNKPKPGVEPKPDTQPDTQVPANPNPTEPVVAKPPATEPVVDTKPATDPKPDTQVPANPNPTEPVVAKPPATEPVVDTKPATDPKPDTQIQPDTRPAPVEQNPGNSPVANPAQNTNPAQNAREELVKQINAGNTAAPEGRRTAEEVQAQILKQLDINNQFADAREDSNAKREAAEHNPASLAPPNNSSSSAQTGSSDSNKEQISRAADLIIAEMSRQSTLSLSSAQLSSAEAERRSNPSEQFSTYAPNNNAAELNQQRLAEATVAYYQAKEAETVAIRAAEVASAKAAEAAQYLATQQEAARLAAKQEADAQIAAKQQADAQAAAVQAKQQADAQIAAVQAKQQADAQAAAVLAKQQADAQVAAAQPNVAQVKQEQAAPVDANKIKDAAALAADSPQATKLAAGQPTDAAQAPAAQTIAQAQTPNANTPANIAEALAKIGGDKGVDVGGVGGQNAGAVIAGAKNPAGDAVVVQGQTPSGKTPGLAKEAGIDGSVVVGAVNVANQTQTNAPTKIAGADAATGEQVAAGKTAGAPGQVTTDSNGKLVIDATNKTDSIAGNAKTAPADTGATVAANVQIGQIIITKDGVGKDVAGKITDGISGAVVISKEGNIVVATTTSTNANQTTITTGQNTTGQKDPNQTAAQNATNQNGTVVVQNNLPNLQVTTTNSNGVVVVIAGTSNSPQKTGSEPGALPAGNNGAVVTNGGVVNAGSVNANTPGGNSAPNAGTANTGNQVVTGQPASGAASGNVVNKDGSIATGNTVVVGTNNTGNSNAGSVVVGNTTGNLGGNTAGNLTSNSTGNAGGSVTGLPGSTSSNTSPGNNAGNTTGNTGSVSMPGAGSINIGAGTGNNTIPVTNSGGNSSNSSSNSNANAGNITTGNTNAGSNNVGSVGTQIPSTGSTTAGNTNVGTNNSNSSNPGNSNSGVTPGSVVNPGSVVSPGSGANPGSSATGGSVVIGNTNGLPGSTTSNTGTGNNAGNTTGNAGSVSMPGAGSINTGAGTGNNTIPVTNSGGNSSNSSSNSNANAGNITTGNTNAGSNSVGSVGTQIPSTGSTTAGNTNVGTNNSNSSNPGNSNSGVTPGSVVNPGSVVSPGSSANPGSSATGGAVATPAGNTTGTPAAPTNGTVNVANNTTANTVASISANTAANAPASNTSSIVASTTTTPNTTANITSNTTTPNTTTTTNVATNTTVNTTTNASLPSSNNINTVATTGNNTASAANTGSNNSNSAGNNAGQNTAALNNVANILSAVDPNAVTNIANNSNIVSTTQATQATQATPATQTNQTTQTNSTSTNTTAVDQSALVPNSDSQNVANKKVEKKEEEPVPIVMANTKPPVWSNQPAVKANDYKVEPFVAEEDEVPVLKETNSQLPDVTYGSYRTDISEYNAFDEYGSRRFDIIEKGLNDPYSLEAMAQREKERYELKEKEEREQKIKEERERKEREEKEREIAEKAKRLADALLTEMATRKANDLANKNKAIEDALSVAARTKYVILPGDTLESIATKKLGNKKLAELIYEINKGTIPYRIVDGRQLLQLRPRAVLQLPTKSEIKRFISRVFFSKPMQFEYDTLEAMAATVSSNVKPSLVKADPATLKRRENVEKLLGSMSNIVKKDERIKYTCRLGDTLRSLAISHPSLKDVSLWKLVAQLNNLSLKVDGKGHPVAVLKRGVRLIIPTKEEIVLFREQMQAKISPSKSDLPRATDSFKGADDIVVKDVLAVIEKTKVSISKTQIVASGADTTGNKEAKSKSAINSREIKCVFTSLSDSCRLAKFENGNSLGIGHFIRLELNTGIDWVPIIQYDITKKGSWRHEYSLGGSKKSNHMDLPPQVVKQMCENDFATNWQQYCDIYLANTEKASKVKANLAS
jgi:hypothetical protein